jgi:hypothetical protein
MPVKTVWTGAVKALRASRGGEVLECVAALNDKMSDWTLIAGPAATILTDMARVAMCLERLACTEAPGLCASGRY